MEYKIAANASCQLGLAPPAPTSTGPRQPAGWHVEITARARRDLRNLDPPVRARVFDALAGLVGDPLVGDVKKLAGQDAQRLR